MAEGKCLTYYLIKWYIEAVCNTVGAAPLPFEWGFLVYKPKRPVIVRWRGGFLRDHRQRLGFLFCPKSKTAGE
jgi:hypothetical protein